MSEIELFPSWSDSFDDTWGIYNVEDGLPVPQFVKNSLAYLIAVWALIYFLLSFLSGFFNGGITGEGCPRVAVAFGCLYRGIGHWLDIVPRLTTCTFIHYTAMHLMMNSYSIGGSYQLLLSAFPNPEDIAWVYYWTIPIWYMCSLVGSLLTYFGHLKKVSSFSVGASGGACGFSIFATLMVFMHVATHDNSSGYTDAKILSLLQTLVMVIVQSSPLAVLTQGKKVDWMAHLGGSLMGAVLAFIMESMVRNIDTPSLLRMGAIGTIAVIAIAVGCFLWVIVQFNQGHEDRVRQCYIQWLQLDNIQLVREAESRRRWTLGHVDKIERELNAVPREPRVPPTAAERAEEAQYLQWREHALDPDVSYYNTRRTF